MPIFQKNQSDSGKLSNLSKVIQVLRACDHLIIHLVDHKANNHFRNLVRDITSG